MGSLLSTSLGFDAITRDDLLELGFSPYKPISFIFGEPYAFRRDFVIYKHPNPHRRRDRGGIGGAFQLIVTFPRTTKPADGNPVAVLTRKIFDEGIGWHLDSKNAITKRDCDLPTLKAMMDENYLRSLI